MTACLADCPRLFHFLFFYAEPVPEFASVAEALSAPPLKGNRALQTQIQTAARLDARSWPSLTLPQSNAAALQAVREVGVARLTFVLLCLVCLSLYCFCVRLGA